MIVSAPGRPRLPPRCRHHARRHCSRYVKYTAWFTWPIASQSRKRTARRWLKAKASVTRVEYLTTVTTLTASSEQFSAEETRALAPYFTNADRPVFALTNLPETVKGALFARYSRSAKSLRRLFLDEFLGDVHGGATAGEIEPAVGGAAAVDGVGAARADKLYAKVLNEYGDDSVAQLGAAHLACEGVSNVLTKILEWGRLMAYLEQSTRYVPYTDRPHGRWKYHVPAELDGSPLRDRFEHLLDRAFETYARWIPALESHFRAKYPKAPEDSDGVYRSV